MAKPEQMGLDALVVPAVTPKAATPARSPKAAPAPVKEVENVPFQVRIPKTDAKAIRVTAAQREQSISDFVLMCVREWQERNPGADRG